MGSCDNGTLRNLDVYYNENWGGEYFVGGGTWALRHLGAWRVARGTGLCPGSGAGCLVHVPM